MSTQISIKQFAYPLAMGLTSLSIESAKILPSNSTGYIPKMLFTTISFIALSKLANAPPEVLEKLPQVVLLATSSYVSINLSFSITGWPMGELALNAGASFALAFAIKSCTEGCFRALSKRLIWDEETTM